MENLENIERNDHKEMIAVAKRNNVEHLAVEAIEKGQSMETFRARVMDAVKTEPLGWSPAVSLNEREMETFSIAKAIMAKADGNWSEAGFEREVLQHTAICETPKLNRHSASTDAARHLEEWNWCQSRWYQASR